MMVQFGIWMFDEKMGIIGRPKKYPEIFLHPDRIWDTKETRLGPVWKWPVQFAKLAWFSPHEADNFNKTFLYAQEYFEGFNPGKFHNKFDIDARTIKIQTEVLSDHFPGPTEELDIRK